GPLLTTAFRGGCPVPRGPKRAFLPIGGCGHGWAPGIGYMTGSHTTFSRTVGCDEHQKCVQGTAGSVTTSTVRKRSSFQTGATGISEGVGGGHTCTSPCFGSG